MGTLRCLLSVFVMLVALQLTGRAANITTIDGKEIQGNVRTITDEGKVVFSDAPSIKLQHIWKIRAAGATPRSRTTGTFIQMIGTGRIYTKSVAIRSNEVIFKSILGDTSRLPLRYIRGIRFQSDQSDQTEFLTRFNDLLDQDINRDRAIVKTNDGIVTVDCFVSSLDSNQLTVQYKKQTRIIPRKEQMGIVLAQTTRSPNRSGHAHITLTDGSTLWARIVKLKNKRLTVALFTDQKSNIPWEYIANITINSRRMTFLSDLEPVSVEQRALVTFPWPYKKDTNVMGQPLVIDGEKYERGIGMHSRCRLTYNLNENYQNFVATIGIDDGTEGQGDCIFKIYGEDTQLFEQRIQGTDSARQIKVDLGDHDRFTFAVEPGKKLDIADNANWCDARFTK